MRQNKKLIQQLFDIQEKFLDKYDDLFRRKGKEGILSVGIITDESNKSILNIRITSKDIGKKISNEFMEIPVIKVIEGLK